MLIPARHDLIEVLVRLARVDEARARLGEMSGGGADHAARAERCRALVSEHDDEALAHFEAALSHHAEEPAALEHARTNLLYGERLRSMRRRAQGRAQLERALTGLERVGAEGFAERARAELRATGSRPARRDPATSETLTGQERQIAAQVALGLRSGAQMVRLVAEGGLGEGVGAETPRR